MKRLDPEARKEQILNVAVELAELLGYDKIRRDGIAEKANVADGLVTRYFNTMNQLKRAVMRHAVTNDNVIIVAQGIAARDPQALKAPDALRQKALAHLARG